MVGVSFMPLLGYGAAAASASIAFFASATSTASTITLPASIDAGDLILLLQESNSSTVTVTPVTPTGFTNLVNINIAFGFTGEIRVMVDYKLADGTETGSITGMNSSTNNKILAIFRRSPAASALSFSTPTTQTTSGDPTSQNIAASGGTVPLIGIGGFYSSGGLIGKSFSPAADASIAVGTGLNFDYKIYNSSPVNITIDEADGGTNALVGFYAQMA